MKQLYALCLSMAFFLFSVLARADDAYLFARDEKAVDLGMNYGMSLLTAALDASKAQYGLYTLSSVKAPTMQHKRLLLEMEEGKEINLSVKVTSPEWERALIPIRIPIDKGLDGFRISMIDGRRQEEFRHMTSLQQLMQLSVGVGAQWATRDVYEKDGLHVVTGTSYPGLFGMLMTGRFDYLPRSIEEVLRELPAQVSSYPNLAEEQSFVLHVPMPTYFFVSPSAPRLAERLRLGLEKLIANGEFNRLFLEHYGPLIAKVNLCARTVFSIPNPDLGPETPLQRKALWFDPFDASSKDFSCRPAKPADRKISAHSIKEQGKGGNE